jgi:hypothetical protein
MFSHTRVSVFKIFTLEYVADKSGVGSNTDGKRLC